MSEPTPAPAEPGRMQLARSLTDAMATARAAVDTNVVTTLDLTNKAEFGLLIASEMDEAVGIHESAVNSIECVAVIRRTFEQTDEASGEVVTKDHTRFIDVHGRTYWTNSAAVARVAGLLLMALAKKGRFNPPVTMVFKRQRTSNGGNAILLHINSVDVTRLLGLSE